MQVREDILNVPANRKSQKLEKRRIKYYDTISDEEEELEQQIEGDLESFQISVEDDRETLEEKRKQVKVEKEPILDKIISLKQMTTEKVVKKERNKDKESFEAMIVEAEQDPEIVILQAEGETESHLEEESNNKYLLKKKRFRKPALIDKEDIDDSKIISEVSIDQGNIISLLLT